MRTIVEMVVHTRLDCVLGTAAGMRQAVEQATHHAAHRSAFGELLVEQPLMQNVLADLCVESEAATVTALRLARAYDRRAADEREAAFARIATPIAKYWVCKRGPAHAAEALECLGGNGYVEESGLPRVYRQQPLQSIWEGSGNVVCLDVLRAIRREPETVEALLAELEPAATGPTPRRRWRDADEARRPPRSSSGSRVALQGSLLVRHAPAAVADAFRARRARLRDAPRKCSTFRSIIERHRPIVG